MENKQISQMMNSVVNPIATSLECSIQHITPGIAGMYLVGVENYRRTRNARVLLYADLMKNGKWIFPGPPIILDTQKRAIDGKHRLEAVILAERTIQFVVIGGYPYESRIAFDDNLVRTKADVLIAECNVTERANDVAAILRIVPYGLDLYKKGAGKLKISNVQAAAQYEKYIDVITIALKCIPSSIRGLSSAPVMAAFARAAKKYPKRVDDLIIAGRKMSDFNFGPEDTSLQLLTKFLTGYRSNGRDSQCEVYGKTSRALVAWLNNEPMAQLKMPSQELL